MSSRITNYRSHAHRHRYVTNIQKDKYRSPPRQAIQLKWMKPDQAYTSNNIKFGDRMKTVLLSILKPKYKVSDNYKEKCKGVPSMTHSQRFKKTLAQFVMQSSRFRVNLLLTEGCPMETGRPWHPETLPT